MEERFGQRGTVVDGVFFTEGPLPGEDRGSAAVTIGRQNSNLSEVKQRLVQQVLDRGGNALSDFEYGQAGRKWWKIGWDEEQWYGSGRVRFVEP